MVCEVNCSEFLSCSVEWTFESVSVDLASGKYETRSNGSVHHLSVLQPAKKDLGRYTCILKSLSNENEDSRTLVLRTPGKPVLNALMLNIIG